MQQININEKINKTHDTEPYEKPRKNIIPKINDKEKLYISTSTIANRDISYINNTTNKKIKSYSIFINGKLNLDILTEKTNYTKALELITKLQTLANICLEVNEQFFFESYIELYHLINKEHKYIFRENIDNNHQHILNFGDYITKTITTKQLNRVLSANIDELACEIFYFFDTIQTDIFFKHPKSNKIISYLRLLEKHIQNNSITYATKDNKNYFDILFNQGFMLFFLIANDYYKEFNYIIHSKYLPKNFNVSKDDFPSWMVYYNIDFAKMPKFLLTAVVLNYDSIKNINLAFIKANNGKLTKNVVLEILQNLGNTQNINPQILLDIIKNTPEEFFYDIMWNEASLKSILATSISFINPYLLAYIQVNPNKITRQQHYILLCKLLKNFSTDNLTCDYNYNEIKNYFFDLLSLLHVEFKNKNSKISDFMLNTIIPTLLKFDDITIDFSIFFDTTKLNLVLDILNSLTTKKLHLFCIEKYNFEFIRLIAYVTNFTQGNLKFKAIRLYDKYLQLNYIKQLANKEDFIALFGDLSGNTDWSDIDATNYILVSGNLILLMSDKQLLTFTTGNFMSAYKIIHWKNIYLLENGECLNSYNLNEIFNNHFTLFKQQYNFYNNKSKLLQFIDVIVNAKYKNDFLLTLSSQGLHKKLISLEDNTELSNHFMQYINLDHVDAANNSLYPITEEHLSFIKDIFNLQKRTNARIAQHLVCLAFVFVKYASASIFGNEDNSPIALRKYASALLYSAYSLYPKCFIKIDNGFIENLFHKWNNKLLGLNKEFSCADFLAADMLVYINDNYLQTTIIKTIPTIFM